MVALAGIVKQGTFVNIDKIQIDVFVVDQNLKNLHLFQRLGSDSILHLAETVEDRRSIVLVKGIDLATMLEKDIQQFKG